MDWWRRTFTLPNQTATKVELVTYFETFTILLENASAQIQLNSFTFLQEPSRICSQK